MSDPVRPRITLGITGFREGGLLKECLESLFRQTIHDWNAVVVLDGGYDEPTRAALDEFDDPRLKKILLTENVGPYGTMGLAIQNSATDAFYFLGADDFLPDYALEEAAAAFDDPEVDYFCGQVRLFWADGTEKILDTFPPDAVRLLRHGQFPGLVAFRKRIWEALGGYPPELIRGMGDLDLILSLIEGGYRYRLCHRIVYEYRQRPASVSRSYSHELGYKCEVIVRRHPSLFQDESLRREYLCRGYLSSAWNCYRKNMMAEAAEYARKYAALDGRRAVSPLHLADRLPAAAVRALVGLRESAGRLKRALRPNPVGAAPAN